MLQRLCKKSQYTVNNYCAHSLKILVTFQDNESIFNHTDDQADISLYLNTPGGQVSSGLAIYDTMQIISPDVATICTGMAASMGSVLLTAGAQGKRPARLVMSSARSSPNTAVSQWKRSLQMQIEISG